MCIKIRMKVYILQDESISNLINWIYNLICAVIFSKFELLFKKNMYNSIIQSIAHLKL